MLVPSVDVGIPVAEEIKEDRNLDGSMWAAGSCGKLEGLNIFTLRLNWAMIIKLKDTIPVP